MKESIEHAKMPNSKQEAFLKTLAGFTHGNYKSTLLLMHGKEWHPLWNLMSQSHAP